MKKYTIQFEMEEGNDEFWNSSPTPGNVLAFIREEFNSLYIHINNIKIIKIIDVCIYDTEEDMKEEE